MLTDEKIDEIKNIIIAKGGRWNFDFNGFARLIESQMYEKLKRPAPCEHFCEANAFNIEIRQLRNTLRHEIDKHGGSNAE